jgi:hypothetical protein
MNCLFHLVCNVAVFVALYLESYVGETNPKILSPNTGLFIDNLTMLYHLESYMSQEK